MHNSQRQATLVDAINDYIDNLGPESRQYPHAVTLGVLLAITARVITDEQARQIAAQLRNH